MKPTATISNSKWQIINNMECNSCGKTVEGEFLLLTYDNEFKIFHRKCSGHHKAWQENDSRKNIYNSDYYNPYQTTQKTILI